MKTFSILTLLLLVTQFHLFAQTEIYFNLNSQLVNTSEEPKLDSLLTYFRQHGGVLYLVGHTDKSGDASYNLKLSERRVNAIKTYFQKKGVSTDHLVSSFKGEAEAHHLNPAYNRKVSIEIRASHASTKALDQLIEHLAVPTQSFSIHADSDVVLQGKEGIMVSMKAGTLVLPNGDLPTGPIHYELKEFHSKASFIGERLFTTAGDEIIESGGMISLEAYNNGERLTVGDGKDFAVEFPKAKDQSDFQTFYGKRLPNGNMDWEATDDSDFMANKDLSFVLMLGNAEFARIENGEMTVNDSVRASYQADSTTINNWEKEKSKEKARSGFSGVLKSARLGFINCDRFLRNQRRVPVKIQIASLDTAYQTIGAYLVFRNINSVLPLYAFKQQTYRLQSTIPINSMAQLVVVGWNQESKTYGLYAEEYRTVPRLMRKVEFSEASLKDLEKLLK